MANGISLPDPFLLRAAGVNDNFAGLSYKTTNGLTIRSPTINPAIRSLVLITAGQSNYANVNPSAFVPTNAAVVDQLNIFDGAIYSIAGPLLGSTLNSAFGAPGYGNLSARVADLLVTNGKFDRVIAVSTAVGSTTASMWGDATGELYNRTSVAMARLASRGVVPGLTGLTFACIFGLGETDNVNGTAQAAFAASANGFLSALFATGFNGRVFVPQESYNGGATSANVRAAQAALWNGTTIVSGGDLDTLTGANRQADNVHFSDAGAAAAATLIYNAMHASGAPF